MFRLGLFENYFLLVFIIFFNEINNEFIQKEIYDLLIVKQEYNFYVSVFLIRIENVRFLSEFIYF